MLAAPPALGPIPKCDIITIVMSSATCTLSIFSKAVTCQPYRLNRKHLSGLSSFEKPFSCTADSVGLTMVGLQKLLGWFAIHLTIKNFWNLNFFWCQFIWCSFSLLWNSWSQLFQLVFSLMSFCISVGHMWPHWTLLELSFMLMSSCCSSRCRHVHRSVFGMVLNVLWVSCMSCSFLELRYDDDPMM